MIDLLYQVEKYDFSDIWESEILPHKKGNPGTKKRKEYLDIVCAFDIETSLLHGYTEKPQSFLYIWQFQIGRDTTIIGRTWEQFRKFIDTLRKILKEKEASIVVYVHNLSYEFQFISDPSIYDFQKNEVFCVKSRKVLRATMYSGLIEFRCSYLHSNMSLAEYLKKFHVKHQKLKLDYKKIRYPWTPLNKRELMYCINDVRGLVEAIYKEMELDGDNLYTIPLTSTGYVRRDVKKSMRTVSRSYIQTQQPDLFIYEMLKEAFQGGYTHANRFYSGEILSNVVSFDRSSSYPDVLCNCLFPVSRFYQCGEITIEKFSDLLKRDKAILARIGISGLKIREEMRGCPYISLSKTRACTNYINDNGRLLYAEYLETTVTDIDFRILTDVYTFDDIVIIDCAYARYGKLPPELVKTICFYYEKKTTLKGVQGEENFYMKSKNKLNSVYGMMVQDIAKQMVLYISGAYEQDDKDTMELLENASKRAFLAYQWGVWCTAHARNRLYDGIKIVGDDFVYCDTDSVKHLGDYKEQFENYNKKMISASKKSGAFATDKKGVTHYMGVYEMDGIYKKFVTLGAKKYAYLDERGKLGLTVAGVNKKKGAIELMEKGGIKAFKPGFLFIKGGGTESVYNDLPSLKRVVIDGHELEITKNVAILDSTYLLGITGEYQKILQFSKSNVDIIVEMLYN